MTKHSRIRRLTKKALHFFVLFAATNLSFVVPEITISAAENAVPENKNVVPENEGASGTPILVEATRHEGKLLDAPMSVSVVSSEEIFNSSAGTLADALSNISGVKVESPGSMFKQVNIRGEDNQRVLILVDGEEISEQKGLNGSPLLISLQDIERVEVIKGPSSVLYGSGAIGGVVNVLTKKNAENGVHGSAGIRADSGTDGLEQFYDLNAREDAFFFRAQYSDIHHGNIISPSGTVDNTDYRFTSASFLAGYDISENATLRLKFETFHGHSNVHVDQDSVRAAVAGTSSMALSLPDWDRLKVSGNFEWKDISEVLVKLRISAFYQQTYKQFLQSIGLSVASPYAPNEVSVNTKNILDVVGGEIQADFELGNDNYLISGACFQFEKLRSHQTSQTNYASGTTTSSSKNDKAEIFSASIYGNDEWAFADGWKLVAGARGTFYKNQLLEGGAIASGTSDDYEDLHATFSLSLVNTQLENWAFRGIVAQGYRYGTANELYIGNAGLTPWTMSGASGVIVPNPDLKPESSTNFEIGARFGNDNFNFDISAFYTISDDYIAIVERTDESGTSTNYVENIDSCRTFGSELSLSYDFRSGRDFAISPYFTGTFMRRRFEDNGVSSYKNNMPQLFGKVGTRGKIAGTANAAGTRTAWFDLNLRMSDEAKNTDSAPIPGWATLNFAFGIDFTSSQKSVYFRRLSISLGIDNILDKSYRLPAKFPYDLHVEPYEQVGRSFWIALKYEF